MNPSSSFIGRSVAQEENGKGEKRKKKKRREKRGGKWGTANKIDKLLKQ